MSHCTFCQIVSRQIPAYIVYEDADYLAFLDKFPQTRGHLQLIPKRHYKWVYDVPNIGQFFSVAKQIIHAIIPILGADHVTIASFGRQIEHAHLWIVPQYRHSQTILEGSGKSTKQEELEEVAMLLREGILKVT